VKCRSIKYKQPKRYFVFRCAYTHSATFQHQGRDDQKHIWLK